MTPETFNAQLAQRKLEAADILLVQAKRGSDADRIRAASAILRIAFFPERATDRLSSAGRCSTPEPPAPAAARPAPSPQAEGLPVRGGSRGHSDESSRSAAPGTPPNPSPTPHGSYSPAPAPITVATSTHATASLTPVNSS